jgi:Berberine and berberine like
VIGAVRQRAERGMADWEREYYGCNRERLRRVKAKYDPEIVSAASRACLPGDVAMAQAEA